VKITNKQEERQGSWFRHKSGWLRTCPVKETEVTLTPKKKLASSSKIQITFCMIFIQELLHCTLQNTYHVMLRLQYNHGISSLTGHLELVCPRIVNLCEDLLHYL